MSRRDLHALGLSLALASAAAGCAGQPAQSAPPIPSVRAERSPVLLYAEQQLAGALASAHSAARVRVTLADDAAATAQLAAEGAKLPAQAESFAAISTGTETLIVGRDPAGALYGALEIVGRLEAGGAAALPLAAPITGAPAVPVRGANPFLVMPARGEPGFWFREESYWREYLDLMARARLNYLDIHGMYNTENTLCPNALLYFATSKSFPDVGAPKADREQNVKMLQRIVEMASERGISVGLMSYQTGTDLTTPSSFLRKKKEALDDASLQTYTREAVRDLLEKVPGLARLGFRIGESGHQAGWFSATYVASVDAVDPGHGKIGLSTRTWLSNKAEILEMIGTARRDTLVEAKYNGEQSGPPYQVAGGLMTRPEIQDTSYSYEDYLDPPSPANFVFHIWTGGTNRVFRHASYERIRRTVPTTLLGGARGFSLLAPHAFYPQYDFYHADPKDQFSPWAFRRDELEYLMFGRLGYDPATPERVFRDALRRRTGTDALWDPLQASSDIVPWILASHTCGVDHRWSTPEMEWNGSVGFWASPADTKDLKAVCGTKYHGPYDIFAVASPFDAATDLALGRATTRLSPLEVARILIDDVRRARAAESASYDAGNAEARDVAREAVAISYLGEYQAHKLRGATALAVFERTGREDYLAEAKRETALADQAWEGLVKATSYIRTIDEQLRMGLVLGYKQGYHWSMQRLDADPASIEEAVQRVRANPPKPAPDLPAARAFLDAPRAAGPGLARLTPASQGSGRFHVTATFASPVPAGARVRVLYKALSSLADWKSADAAGAGATFVAGVTLPSDAGLFAVEVEGKPGAGWRYPDVLKETPYVAVPHTRR